MKLFYSEGACSMSCHIALEESGLSYQALKVDWDKPDAHSAELEKLNPRGQVPVFVSDDGKTLTQNMAILEYIADKKPELNLIGALGSWERYQTTSWLSFVGADLHQTFSPLFALDHIFKSDAAKTEVREWSIKTIKTLFSHVDKSLAGKDYLVGKQFTVADAYMFTVVNWGQYFKISLDEYSNLKFYMTRIQERPAVQKVMKEEGLFD